jgi:hypothetical protein
MGLNKRTLMMTATAMLAALTVLYMQSRFERADERHGLELVQSYHSKAGVSVPELIAVHHPDKVVEWSTHTESSCFQHIRVAALVHDAPEVTYQFDVDINGPSIHPANDAGLRLLGEMDVPSPHLSASATAAASASAAP